MHLSSWCNLDNIPQAWPALCRVRSGCGGFGRCWSIDDSRFFFDAASNWAACCWQASLYSLTTGTRFEKVTKRDICFLLVRVDRGNSMLEEGARGGAATVTFSAVRVFHRTCLWFYRRYCIGSIFPCLHFCWLRFPWDLCWEKLRLTPITLTVYSPWVLAAPMN